MEIYLDNAATTKAAPCAVEAMKQVLSEDYGNPSSLHRKGMQAEQYIRQARAVIAETLRVEEKEIVFTSGGTESNNMALFGAAYANRRRGTHIVSTVIEHPSVYQPLAFLEKNGFTVTYLPVDQNGILQPEVLREALREDTILVSVMMVNNEIGSVQDIPALASVIKEKCPEALFHVDAIQGYGKYRIFPKKWGIDLLSVSGHKLHAPKGSGFIYVREKAKVQPLVLGGGQQKGMRSGTENVPAIAGLAAAVQDYYRDWEKRQETLYALKEYFVERVQTLDGVTVNAIFAEQTERSLSDRVRQTAPHIVSVSFAGVRSEVLLHALEEHGIYVSSGSACSSNHPAISGTLQAIGVKKELLDATLRFSFSSETTKEDLDDTVDKLRELLSWQRKFVRK